MDVIPPGEGRAEVDRLAAAGAFIMGRNMFGPVRGGWDREWNGWWGDDPPYHALVFVLTHHPHDPQPMDGGTTFHFILLTRPIPTEPINRRRDRTARTTMIRTSGCPRLPPQP